jgi:hypothetical protein
MGTRGSRASAIDSGLDVGLFDRRDIRRHHDWLTAPTPPRVGQQAAGPDERRGSLEIVSTPVNAARARAAEGSQTNGHAVSTGLSDAGGRQARTPIETGVVPFNGVFELPISEPQQGTRRQKSEQQKNGGPARVGLLALA